MASISKQSILQIHQRLLRTEHYNNDHQQEQITNILGGIDNMLKMVLSSDDAQLNNNQLFKLHQRLVSKQTIQESNANGLEIQGRIECTHYFIRTNTFLHFIFGQNYGQKLFNFVYSPYLIYLMYIMQPIAYILHNLFRLFMVSFPMYIITIIWMVFILLSTNRKAFKFTIQSFGFWIKIFYTLRFIIATLILRQDHIYPASRCIMYFWWVLLYSFMDGLQLPSLFMVLVGIKIAAHFSCLFIAISLDKLYSPIMDRYIDINICSQYGLKTSFSLLSMIQGAALILAIFFWRAIILKLIHRKRQKCVFIRSVPYCQWIRNATIDNQQQMNEMINNMNMDTNNNSDDANGGSIFVDETQIKLDQSDKDNEKDLSSNSDSDYLCANDDQVQK